MNHLTKNIRLLKLFLAMMIALLLIGSAFLIVPIASGATKGIGTVQDDSIRAEGYKLPSLSSPASPSSVGGGRSGAYLPMAQQTLYTIPMIIDNTDNTSVLTDYQILVTWDTATPVSQGRMRSDCGDIRFYDSTQAISLPYWLEAGCDTASTQVWVKVPAIPATSTQKIYLIYGNSSLPSTSNGEAVFEFFDDFTGIDGSALNSSKWITDAVNTVTASIQNNKYRITDGTKSSNAYWIYNDTDSGSQDQAVFTLPTRFIVDWESTVENTSASYMGQGGTALVGSSDQIEAYLSHDDPNTCCVNLTRSWIYASTYQSEAATSGETKKFSIIRDDSTVKFYIDGVLKSVGSMNATPTKLAIAVGAYGPYPYLDYIDIDNLRVRKHTSPEPTVFEAGLVLTQSGSTQAPLGGVVTYSLTIQNNDIVTASNVVITHTLPASIAFASASTTPQQISPLVWQLGNIPPLTSTTLTITGSVGSAATIGSSLLATATVTSDLTEANLTNNTASFTSTVTAGPGTWLALTVANEVDMLMPFTATVTAYNQYGNIATDYTGTVTLTSTGVVSGFPVTHQFTTTNQGVYTFTSLVLKTVGLQTITATDGVLSQTRGIIVDDNVTIAQNTTWKEVSILLETLAVTNGAKLTLERPSSTFTEPVVITASNITVDSGAMISTNGQGYPQNDGDGKGQGSGAGAGYGGYGGQSYFGGYPGGQPYGNLYHPQELGSGGSSCWGSGGTGGGAIHLVISDTFTLNGILSANGTNGTYGWNCGGGGGSGGAIWVETSIITGNSSGVIQANGGNGGPGAGENWRYGSGGSGGRIALKVIGTDNFSSQPNRLQVYGGSGYKSGELGTIYLGYIDPLTSTVAISPTSIPANGIAVGTITVTLRTITGALIVGEPVSVTLKSGSQTTTYINSQPASVGAISLGQTNANGVTTASITSTTSETKTVEAVSGVVRLVNPGVVFFDTDFVDATASLVSIQGPSTVTANGSEIEVRVTARDKFGNLVPNVTTTLGTTPTVTVTEVSTLTNASGQATYRISHDQPAQVVISATVNSQLVGNVVTATFEGADLLVTKNKVAPAQLVFGFPATYTLTVQNTGSLTATNVVITDTLPGELTYASYSSAANLNFSQSGSNLVWQASDDLGPSQSLVVTLVATVATSLADGTPVTNTVTATTGAVELNTTNNTATAAAPARPPRPQLTLSPGSPILALKPGQTQSLTVTVGNSGDLVMTNGVMTGPTVMPWLDLTPATLPDLAPGQQTVITLTASPGSSAPVGTYRDFVMAGEGSGGQQRAILRVDLLPTTRTLQLTFNNDQGQPVSGASINLLLADALVDVTPAFTNYLDVNTGGTTGPDGLLTLTDLPVGTYNYDEISAPNHDSLAAGTLTVSAGGSTQNESFTLTARPALQVTPLSPVLAVAPDETGSQEFTITNNGAAPLTGLSIVTGTLPAWVYLGAPSLVTTTLQPNESYTFILYASPTITEQGVTYQQPITVSLAGGLQQVLAPTIKVTSENTRNLALTVTGNNNQALAGATVTLVRQAPSFQVTQGVTRTYHERFTAQANSSGQVSFTALPVGGYDYVVQKQGYKTGEGSLQVELPESGGSSSQQLAFELAASPFEYIWSVTPLQVGYEISLTMTHAVDNEEIQLLAPTRSWDFCQNDPTLEDNIAVYNMSNVPATFNLVAVNVPGVDVAVNSIPTVLAPGTSGMINVTGTQIGEALGQGQIIIKGSYQATDNELVSYTFNPSSVTSPYFAEGTTYQQNYLLEPAVFNPATTYNLSISQPALLNWVTLSASLTSTFQLTQETDITVTLMATAPTWLTLNETYSDTAIITLAGSDGKIRQNYLDLEVEKTEQGLKLHTTFRLGPLPIEQRPMESAGLIYTQEINCDSGGGGGGGPTESNGNSGGWTWAPLPGGNGLHGTRQSNNGASGGSPPFAQVIDTASAWVIGATDQQARIQLNQKVMLEGEGFQANLTLENLFTNQSVDDITVNLLISDTNDVLVNSSFIITPVVPTLLTDTLPAGEQVLGAWLIVPTESVTDTAGKTYYAAAEITYEINGTSYTFTTLPEEFTVLPAPQLIIDYELPGPNNVCTTFDLRATVRNVGAGSARGVNLTSGQPKIVEITGNKFQGFTIVAVTVDGQPLSSSPLEVDLGEIAAGGEREVIWRMRATQPGRFIEFTSDYADYQIENYYGLSLVPRLQAINTTFSNAPCQEGLEITVLDNQSTILPLNTNSLPPQYTMSISLTEKGWYQENPVKIRVEASPDVLTTTTNACVRLNINQTANQSEPVRFYALTEEGHRYMETILEPPDGVPDNLLSAIEELRWPDDWPAFEWPVLDPKSAAYMTVWTETIKLSPGTNIVEMAAWIQPSIQGELTLDASLRDCDTDAVVIVDTQEIVAEQKGLAVPTANIHPVVFLHGILGSQPPTESVITEWPTRNLTTHLDPYIDSYSPLIKNLIKMGYRLNETLFPTTYDWRKSNQESAAWLHDVLLQKVGTLTNPITFTNYVNADGKADVIVHSMGGMVSRAYIQNLASRNYSSANQLGDYTMAPDPNLAYKGNINQIVFIASPHKGFPFDYQTWEGTTWHHYMSEGVSPESAFVARGELGEILGDVVDFLFPSYYELSGPNKTLAFLTDYVLWPYLVLERYDPLPDVESCTGGHFAGDIFTGIDEDVREDILRWLILQANPGEDIESLITWNQWLDDFDQNLAANSLRVVDGFGCPRRYLHEYMHSKNPRKGVWSLPQMLPPTVITKTEQSVNDYLNENGVPGYGIPQENPLLETLGMNKLTGLNGVNVLKANLGTDKIYTIYGTLIGTPEGYNVISPTLYQDPFRVDWNCSPLAPSNCQLVTIDVAEWWKGQVDPPWLRGDPESEFPRVDGDGLIADYSTQLRASGNGLLGNDMPEVNEIAIAGAEQQAGHVAIAYTGRTQQAIGWILTDIGERPANNLDAQFTFPFTTTYQPARLLLSNADALLAMILRSPVDVLLVDPQGRRIGYDSTNGQIVNEIPGAFYSGNSATEEFFILPATGQADYQVVTTGTGQGDFTLSSYRIDSSGVSFLSDVTGTTNIGQVLSQTLDYSLPTRLIFADDMEGGAANWVVTGTLGLTGTNTQPLTRTWSLTTETTYSSQFAWTDTEGADYQPDSQTSLTLAQPLDLSGIGRARLTFWQRHQFKKGAYGFLEISANQGISWTVASLYQGSADWQAEEIDLTPFIQNDPIGLQLRFRLIVLPDSKPDEGWSIDDVRVEEILNTSPHQLPLVETMEQPSNWLATGGWQAITHTFRTTTTSWLTQDDNATLELARPISLSDTVTPRLIFYDHFTPTLGTTGYVELSADEGATWQRILTRTTALTPTFWARQSADLSQYRGQIIRLRFTFETPSANPGAWLLDDLLVLNRADPIAYTLPFANDSESTDGWLALSGWQYVTSTVHSGQSSWQGTHDGAFLQLDGWLDLSQAVAPQLSFWQRPDLPPDATVSVFVAPTSAITWQIVYSASGSTADWSSETIDLSAYTGEQLKLAFHLALSSSLTANQGWYLDDVSLVDTGSVFQESGGQLVMEAEQFHHALARSNQQWLTQTVTSGYTGTGYVQIAPDIDAQYISSYTSTSPELQFRVTFATTGTYHLWIRGYAPNGAGDSLHLGLTSATVISTTQIVDGITGLTPRQWAWSKRTKSGTVATLQVDEPGLYTLYLWAREDGLKLDRLLLTLENTYQPIGFGPP